MSARVLVWSEFFWPVGGGIEVFLQHLLPALESRGWSIEVVTSHGHEAGLDRGRLGNIVVHRFPFWDAIQRRDPAQIIMIRRDVRRVFEAFRPDVIHVQGVGPSDFFLLDLLRALSIPLIVTMQREVREEVSLGADTLMQQMLAAAQWVVAVSPTVLRQLGDFAAGLRERSSVVFNALGEPTLQPRPLPWDPPALLCLGRLDQQKGFDVALAAFALLAESHPNVQIVIAGEGREREALEAQADALGLASRVAFLGWVDRPDVPRVLNAATIVVMPSRYEGFGLVALETAQMQRPLVGSRAAGIEDIVVDGETGLLVPLEQPAALANAIASLLDHPTRAEAMGRAARAGAQRFGLAQCVAEHEALYRKILGGT